MPAFSLDSPLTAPLQRIQALARPGWTGHGLALLGGALLTLSFAPFNYIMLAPLLMAMLLAITSSLSPKSAFFRAYCFGLGFFGTGVSWVYISIHRYGNTDVVLAALITALFIAILALFPALKIGLLNRYFPEKTLNRYLLAFPCLWVLVDWLQGWLLTGFPWLFVGYTQTHGYLSGYAPLVGVYGISFILAVLAALLNLAGRGLRQAIYAVCAIVLIVAVGYGLRAVAWTQPVGKPKTVSLVQGNIPQHLKWQPGYLQSIIDTYLRLTATQWGRDIIVWPEAALPIAANEVEGLLSTLGRTASRNGSSVILGLPYRLETGKGYYNGLTALGQGSGTYFKRHLVPFGEYLPLQTLLRGLIGFFDIPMSNFISGPVLQPDILAKNMLLAPFICYEIAYPQLVAQGFPQAQALLVISDDSWFGDSIAPAQHLQMAQMRALEVGREVLFDTNDGITAIVNTQGYNVATSLRYEATVVQGTLQAYEGATPLVKLGYGALFAIIVTLLLAALFIR